MTHYIYQTTTSETNSMPINDPIKRKEYLLKNKEHIKQLNKEYRQAHKEPIDEYHRKWVAENKERVREYKRKWYLKNKATISEQQRLKNADPNIKAHRKILKKINYERNKLIKVKCACGKTKNKRGRDLNRASIRQYQSKNCGCKTYEVIKAAI